MLPTTLDLSVTSPAALARTFEVQRINEANRSSYHCSEMHSFVNPYTLDLRRTFPKPNGIFRGVARTQSKLTIGVKAEQSDGSETDAVIIYTLQTAKPVAIIGTDREEEANEVFKAWLGHTNFIDFMKELEI